MLKFIVVLYKKPDLSEDEFVQYLRDVHGPMAEKLPGLRKYIQNVVAIDPNINHPGWNAVVELYWEDLATMETAWKAPEGIAATEDLQAFADLTRTAWSVVEEHVVRG